MAERKLDVFAALRAADNHKSDWFRKQSDDAKKEFAPPVFLRWASSIKGDGELAEYMLMMINDRVNLHMWDLTKHPELIFKLTASCGLGRVLDHQWIPMPIRKSSNNKAINFLMEVYPNANKLEIEIMLSKYDKKTFSDLLDEHGIQADTRKEIIKDFTKTS